MDNKLNETFKKHLKLLREHLKINEYSEFDEPSPKFQSIEDFADKIGWDIKKINNFIDFLISKGHKNVTMKSEMPLYNASEFSDFLQNKEKEQSREKNLQNRKFDIIKNGWSDEIAKRIKKMGTLGWQSYKKKDDYEKVNFWYDNFQSKKMPSFIVDAQRFQEMIDNAYASSELSTERKELLSIIKRAEDEAARGFFE